MDMINKQRLLDEFLELVQIDSATKDERKIADALLAKFRALGITAEEDDTGDKIQGTAGNLLAVMDGGKDAPPCLLRPYGSG